MHDTVTQFFILAAGFVTYAIGKLFDVPEGILVPAVFGSAFGVAFSRPLGEWVRTEACLLVIAGTMATGYAVPFLMLKWPDIPGKGAAFFLSVVLIGFRYQIWTGLGKLITAGFDGASGAATKFFDLLATKWGGGRK